ncbi:RNA methyltransferase [Parasponia andersonii]|uniref:RNA methyltransferase n=1 Tax=Parasponia andersonii TaxID=3476 RepID=A0A2P5CEL5_PARAD|nr:RNA methyltransferase [Parasponia andersonii]
MAVSMVPPLYSLRLNTSTNHGLSSITVPLFHVHARPNRIRRQSTIIVFSSRTSGKRPMSEDAKREFLQKYGLNPVEFLSEPSPKTRRRKELHNTGTGNQIQLEDQKPPRTTHKLLQVLGGKARRKKLLSPKGMDVRPMMEVVKGAAFDILQAAGGCPASLRPGRWLDLYSGTGSVGIEAISRGCSEAHFVEMDPWVVTNVLRPNLEWTGFLDASVIHTVPVENFLDRSEQFVGESLPFDYISVTPPYTQVDYGVLMSQVANSALVGEDTFIVVEYALRTDMLDSCGCLVKITDRRFGRTHLVIYGPKWAQKKRKS